MAWAPDYVTVDELARYVRIGDADDNVELGLAITAASRAIDVHTHRQFGQLPGVEARIYTPRWLRRECRWVLDIDDLQTPVGLLVNADLDDDGAYTDVIDEFTMRPVNAAQEGRPWTRLVVLPTSTNRPNGNDAGVQVTGRFGWSEVPDAVRQATLLQASRFHARRDSPYGVAGSPELGSELRLLRRLDADVAVALTGLIRWWAAA